MSASKIGRRLCILGLAAGLAAAALPSVPSVAASAKAAVRLHPAVRHMQKVASDLLRAQQRGTIASFSRALARHADIPAIADYSLGRYKSALPRSQTALYYRGVRAFMARYFADQSRKYRIVRTSIEETPRREGNDYIVRSRVWLDTGASYGVVWRLARKRGAWRVTDVKVMGFSLSFLQRGIFYRYLRKKNGDVRALVAALNR